MIKYLKHQKERFNTKNFLRSLLRENGLPFYLNFYISYIIIMYVVEW